MGKDRISSQEIAEYTNINATQIRRDLSGFGKFGKRGVGYNIDSLLGEIRKILRTQGQHNIALVGAGRLGAGDRELADLRRARDHHRGGLRQRPRQGGPRGRQVSGSAARRADGRSSASRTSSSACSPFPPERPGSGRRPRRRGREDRLQLLRGAARHARRRAGAHVESGRRAPLRALLPPDVGESAAGPRSGRVEGVWASASGLSGAADRREGALG